MGRALALHMLTNLSLPQYKILGDSQESSLSSTGSGPETKQQQKDQTQGWHHNLTSTTWCPVICPPMVQKPR